MKKQFFSHYPPGESELRDIWDTGFVVLDASVLLNLYRYTPDTRKAFTSALARLSDKLWIPHQAAMEYQRNRLEVIHEQVTAYKEIKEVFRQVEARLQSDLGKYRKHPYVNVRDLLESLCTALADAGTQVDEAEQLHADLIPDDSLREQLTALLEGKVGAPYSADEMQGIVREGEERFRRKVPPGFADQGKKTEGREYGDLIFWKQILDRAKAVDKHVLVIIDDLKDDWWWKFKGKTLGPRPELVDEFHSVTGRRLHMYSSDRFISYAEKYFDTANNSLAAYEIRALREDDERSSSKLRKEDTTNKKNQLLDLVSQMDESLSVYQGEISKIWARLRELKSDTGGDPDLRKRLEEIQSELSRNTTEYDELRRLRIQLVEQVNSIKEEA